ncbi:NUDIX hydrolase [Blastochloris viridis]|uniref:NUDIX hydrolase n=1 Tax=Blastochloris viridis TaxID=1079 RepID=A0A0H5BIU5_BLAVI|nr:NUDIX hydrolase [Blastochloris viridis]ALK09753.1 Bifunctional NMN adenylyltransferase/Nudix hydrolase [Blastochloris viridis]BAS00352.1 NUDIX hydrolase [Blastochloris viridis]CUU42416.1 Bifunctional NMN adenylyltransferase/Nudix hydrolase [Blastochloris viridis]
MDPVSRHYPAAPVLGASAAIFHGGRLLVARRGFQPMAGLWSLPGGGVELGETLMEALCREVREEVGCEVRPAAFIGHAEIIHRDDDGRVARHMVVACFAAEWLAGEPAPSAEAPDVAWVDRAALAARPTTDRLPELAAAAAASLGIAW